MNALATVPSVELRAQLIEGELRVRDLDLDLTRTIVRVFRAAMRGELVPAQSETRLVLEALRDVVSQLATLRRDVDGMRALTTGSEESPHCIGISHARRLLARIKAVAVESASQLSREVKPRLVSSLRKSIEIEVRARIGFDGAGTRWERLPSTKHAAAYLAIEEIQARENKRNRAVMLARQPTMFAQPS